MKVIDEQVGRGAGSGPPAHPLAACLAAVDQELATVADVECWSLSDDEVAELVVKSLAARAQVDELTTRLVAAAHSRDLAGQSGAASTAAWLRRTARLTRAGAAALARLALGVQRECPQVREAMTRGEVAFDQAQTISGALSTLPQDLPAGVRADAEASMVDHASRHDADELRVLGRRLFEVIDPEKADEREGKLLEEEEQRARRSSWLTMRRNGDGTTRGSFTIPDLSADMLETVLEAYSAPRRDGHTGDAERDEDGRRPTYPERMGRALCEVIEHVPVDRLPQSGGVAALITVELGLDALRAGLGAAALSTGGRISAAEARRLACNAGLVPMVLDGTSRVLDLGRSQRLFDRYQRLALAKQQGGCVFAGCDRPAAWCEAHHVDPWSSGGRTDLARGCLLCPYHHHLVHQGEWQVAMAEDGVPEVVPPARIDPLRRRRRHRRLAKCRAGPSG